MNNTLRMRISATCLSLVLLLGLCPPSVFAAEDDHVVHISSVKDWEQLAANCRLDIWSQDKVVILDCDLDLSNAPSIPTFGGHFDGGGHKLTGFRVSQEGSRQGLFRYVQEGAVIRGIDLTAHILPSGDSDTVGGIAGVNSGVIEDCSFTGFVIGTSAVGGIVGFNGATGQITRCTNRSGNITGEHSTGGVAGVNYGTILGCGNSAQINTQESDLSPQLDEMNWADLNSTENMPACTDTGGIVGYSNGVVKDCSNAGAVGYPHTGYNVGGVAGRQAGYMAGCTNTGHVQGRKEVGGVVGQMEPYTLLRYDEDTLQRLSRELSALSGLVEDTLDSTDSTRQHLSDHITVITGQTNSAKDSIKDLLDEVESVGDETVDTVNELSRRVERMMDQLVPVTDDMKTAADHISDSIRQMEDALDTADGAGDSITDMARSIRSALDHMQKAADTIVNVIGQLPVPLRPGFLPPLAEDFISNLEDMVSNLVYLSGQIGNATAELSSAFGDLKQAAGKVGRIEHILSQSSEELQDSLSTLSTGSDFISNAFQGLQDAIEEQRDLPALELPKLSPEFHDKEDALSDTLTSITDEMEKMNQTADLGGEDLSRALRRVNDQFAAITNVLRDAGKQEDVELVVDISEEDISSTTQGKVENCQNRGTVEGDVNIGGIAGSMAIEYDFDPEDDIIDQGDHSMNYQFLTRVILLNSVNSGSVTARKDCAAGLVGRMELGVAAGCESYGSVESTSGEYVGGIAGLSRGVIRDCWAKCSLSGSRWTGGIAGFATDIRDCRTLVEITDGTSCIGAIAGEMDRGGTLLRNTFVSPSLGGVDSVSYHGKAAPLAYADFMAQEHVPQNFAHLILTFKLNDKILSRQFVPYDGVLEDSRIPAVPPRAGYFGHWEDFEREHILFDREIEAQYAPMLSTLGSADGKILVEGIFTPENTLSVTKGSHPLPVSNSKQGSGPYDLKCDAPVTAVRIALPEGVRKASLMVLDESGFWSEVPTTREGSYLRAEVQGDHLEFCLLFSQSRPWLGVTMGAGIVLLAAAIRLVQKKKAASSKPKPEPETANK